MVEAVLTIHESDVDLYSASILPAGHGHKSLHITLMYEGEVKVFNTKTSDMPRIDEINDIEDYFEKQKAIFELAQSDILYSIDDWCYEIQNNKLTSPDEEI